MTKATKTTGWDNVSADAWTNAQPMNQSEPDPGFGCSQCGAPVNLPPHAGMAVCAWCGSTLIRARRPERAPVPETDRAVLRSVQCPQCAGPLAAHGGTRILACSHCGVRVTVKKQDGVFPWYFPLQLGRLKAVGAASAWLQRFPGISRRARSARFVEARLVWAPIWEYKALVAGWEFGGKLRTRYELVGQAENARLDLRLTREGVEEPHLKERRLYQAATDLDRLGATRPRITGREPVLPLLAGELDASSQVLEVEGSVEMMVEKGRKAALKTLSGTISPDTHLFFLRESTNLLFYPVWLLQYRYGNAVYRVVVNGRNGNVNSATAPAAVVAQTIGLLARAAGVAAGVAVLVWLGLAWRPARPAALAVAAIVSLVAILVWSRFRVQREVEYHEPYSS